MTDFVHSRSDDDILPGRRRRRTARVRPAAPPPPPRPAARRPQRHAPAATAAAGPGRARRWSRTVVVEVLLTLGALLGVAVTGVTVMAAKTGLRPLVVRSGSMEPTIATGSMVLMQRVDLDDIRVGDIVSVERPDHTRVTHRVVAIEPRGATAELTLKGDANEDVDPVPVTVSRAERLVRQFPEAGRAAAWLATPAGAFAMGCAVTAVAMVVLRRRRGERSVLVPGHA